MIELYTRVGKRLCPIDVSNHVMQFPGGELHFKADPGMFSGTEIAVIRGNVSADDFIVLNLWSQVVQDQLGDTRAYIPYLPAARADKGTPLGGIVYANMINHCSLDWLWATDVHSQTAASFYDNLNIANVDKLTHKVFVEENYDAVIAPDAGAVARAKTTADMLGVPLLTATKSRDPKTGYLSEFSCPDAEEFGPGKFLISDDICDGGRTFIGLAEQIQSTNQTCTLDLFVTHGIFSQGTYSLARTFNNIFTTDTFTQPSGYDLMDVQVIPVVDHLLANII